MAGLRAGQVYHGQFEARVTNLLREVRRSGKIILFIDEIHTLVGEESNVKGAVNVANVFKPALARGEMQVSIKFVPFNLFCYIYMFLTLTSSIHDYFRLLVPLRLMNTRSISRKTRHWKDVLDL